MRIILFAVFLGSFQLPAQVAEAVRKTPPPKVASTHTNDAVHKEYKALLELDDAAHQEVDKWILEAEQFEKNGVGTPRATLRARINQRLDEVRSKYEDFVKRNQNHIEARLAYGSFLNGIGEEEEAVVQWEKARELDPKNPASWNNLANYYGHRSPVKKAFEYYEKAIELDPEESVYYHNMATTMYLFRQDAMELYKINETQVFDKSLALYREAMKRDPTNFVLATDYAESFYGTKPPRYKDGLKAWSDAFKIARDEVEKQGVMVHFVRLHINLGEFESAKTNLSRINNPMYAEIKNTLEKKLEREIAKTVKPVTEEKEKKGQDLPVKSNDSSTQKR